LTKLTQMEPINASPKNDIIVAWLSQEYINDPNTTFPFTTVNHTAASLEDTVSILPVDNNSAVETDPKIFITKDWSPQEEETVRQQLHDFVTKHRTGNDNDPHTTTTTTYMFPTGMGSRRRKLIHYIVTTEFHEQLRHWSVGKKNADKTVAIAIRSLIHPP
jgi:hypothetical protein